MEILAIFGAGMLGALVSDIIQDNTLVMPNLQAGKLYLGCIGGLLIGGVAGYLIDGSLTTAFMGGYVGKSIIISLLNNYEPPNTPLCIEKVQQT